MKIRFVFSRKVNIVHDDDKKEENWALLSLMDGLCIMHTGQKTSFLKDFLVRCAHWCIFVRIQLAQCLR